MAIDQAVERQIRDATLQFQRLITDQVHRAERLKDRGEPVNYASKDKITIGVIGGDGIGPYISAQARQVLEHLLTEEVTSGRIEFRTIDGLTIENRARVLKAIPDEVIKQIKECDVLLKGPTRTPRKGDGLPNIESANVAMRKELDLYANVRPVSVPQLGIDWVFYRENTEDVYALGSQGVRAGDVTLDFKVATVSGCDRIIRAAFEYAKANGKTRVTCVTKANVVKTTDGLFLERFGEIAKQYPEITADDLYIDIALAKMIDTKSQSGFQVFVMPNLYGDIATDLAAQIQGGVGTAGSANLGDRYAMFEAIHGSADKMVREDRTQYADPRSMMVAAAMMLRHIGYAEKATRLETAIAACAHSGFDMTGRHGGSTGEDLTDYVMCRLQR